MTDILGPADTVNAVTVRPVETRSFQTQDSFFRDCSSSTADDGTNIDASFLNGIVACLRAFWRMNGGLTASPGTKVVTEDGTDDNGLVKSILHLFQRGQPRYATDIGVAGAIVATMSPVPPEYKEGMSVNVKIAFANTGATTVDLNGLGAKQVVRPDGRPLQKNDVVAGVIANLRYTGTVFQLSGAKINQLTTALTYYVNAGTGNDANDGLTSGTPFATIQRAVDVSNAFDPNGYEIAVNVADGAYAPVSVNGAGAIGTGVLRFTGNPTTPANVNIINPATSFSVSGRSRSVIVNGFKVSGYGSSGCGFLAQDEASLGILNIEFGACGLYHMWSSRASITLIGAVEGLSTSLRISGSATAHMRASGGGAIGSHGTSLNILTAVTITVFAISDSISELTTVAPGGAWYTSIANFGSVTGSKFAVSMNAIISTTGAGINYFPGTTPGTQATGGQYL